MTKTFMKLFGLACTLALPLAMTAQTADSPLTVVPGENSYENTSGSSMSVYYTMTPDEDALVTLEGISISTIKEDDVEIPSCYLTNPTKTMFLAQEGKTYTFYNYVYSDESSTFTAIFTPKPYNNGRDQANPIILEQGENFFPCTREGGWGTPNIPVYAKFTSPQDGKLVITTASSLSGFYRLMPDGNKVAIELSYSNNYRNVIMIDKDEELLFELSYSYGTILSFKVEDSVPGASEDEPFRTQAGENVIPAAAGTYWYSFTTPSVLDKYYVTITSDCDYPVAIMSNGYTQASCNTMAIRESFGGGVTNLIKIEKETATETDGTFNLEFNAPEPYDNFKTADFITAGEEVKTPAFAGRYFYRIQAPETGNWFLDVKSLAEDATELSVYAESNDWSYLVTGASVRCEVEAGKSYVIKATAPQNQLGATFEASFAEVQKGQTAANPLPVEEGVNDVPLWSDVYYTYTAKTDCWIVIEHTGVSVKSVYEDGTYTSVSSYGENKSRFEAIAGKTYNIRFDLVEEGATFTLTEVAYQQGESSTNPIDITSGETKLPEFGGKVWYRFVSDRDGFINISTTLAYASGNSVELYINEITNSGRITMGTEGYYPDYTFKPIRNGIMKGDVAYICVSYSDATEGASITVTTSEANPGETIGTAIPIDFVNDMTYTFPTTNDPIWYSIELPAGMLRISTNDYVTLYLYSADGKNELARAEYDYASYGYTLKAGVEEGKYLICVSYATSDITTTISVSEPEPGQTPATAIVIENAGDPTEFEIPKLERGEQRWYCIDLYEGELSFKAEDSLGGYLYAEGDYDNSLAYISYDWDADESTFTNIAIPAAGRYYFKITSTYLTVAYATLTGTALVHEVVGVEGIEADGTDAEYYTLDGIKVSGKLAPGMYVRVADGKATKVAVKR